MSMILHFKFIQSQQVLALASGSPLEVIYIKNRSNNAEAEVTNKGDELVRESKQTAFGTISVALKVTALNIMLSHAYLEVHCTSNMTCLMISSSRFSPTKPLASFFLCLHLLRPTGNKLGKLISREGLFVANGSDKSHSIKDFKEKCS